MVRDFCPSSIIILLARRPPRTHGIDVVRLDPLDEADTRTYLLAHPAAGSEARSPRGVSEIFRHTDGLPGRIDRALGALRIVSLSELGPPTSNNLVSGASAQEAVPMSLTKVVRELEDSDDPSARRSWLLLKVLAILPHGESLQRLKRIEHDSPIFPKHGEELLERATHFLTRTIGRVSTEMSLHVLAYNMKRVIALLGSERLIEAMRA
jgi:hypothetical protein